MRSAASDQLGATASQSPYEGHEPRDVPGVSAERVVTGSGGQSPTEKPGGACQHCYIRDSLLPSREDRREIFSACKSS